jgi:dTDP-4-dehydrorhamnose reductase
VNVYGESKLAGEEALKESGAIFFLIRTAWLYGTGGKNFVDTMLGLAKERREVSVVNDQEGCPTYAKDVAVATRQLLEKNYPSGIYHLVNAGRATWYDLAVETFRLARLTTTVKPVSSAEFVRPAERPKYSILRNTQGPVLRPWQKALEEYIKGHQL